MSFSYRLPRCLIEAARMDSNFDAAERATIGRLLATRFDLDSMQSLVEQTDRKVQYSAQYFPFTVEICTRLSPEQRVEIIEMLWNVAYADGVLDPHEDMLLRQIAGLIHVPDKERGRAIKPAVHRHRDARHERPAAGRGGAEDQTPAEGALHHWLHAQCHRP